MKSNARFLGLALFASSSLVLGCGGGDGVGSQAGDGAGGIGATGGGAVGAPGGSMESVGAGGVMAGTGVGGAGSGGHTGGTLGEGGVLGTGAGNGGSSGGGTTGGGGQGDGAAGARPDAGTTPDALVSDASGGSDALVDPSKKIKVWMAGDSTMQPCSAACPCGWGSQFQPYFNANATVVNSAAGGRSIQTWLYDPNVTTTMANGECVVNPKTYSARWQAMLDPATGMKPGDYLFIEFGINDGDATCNRHVGTALFETYLGVMAQAAKDRGAQPIFLTSTSYMQCTGAMVTANRGFGPTTKAAGAADDVPVIDLTVLSAALYTSLGLCPNDGSFTSTTTAVGKFFCNDHTHFEAAGASQVAGVVAKALRDQNIGLAAYLK
jgi:lysophospholipase L1-like esterase